MLMSAFVSRAVCVGLLADSIGGLRALFIFCGAQAAMLAAFTTVDGLVALYAVAILFGLGYGGIFPVYAVAIRELMPVTEAGRRTGLVFLFGALSMGVRQLDRRRPVRCDRNLCQRLPARRRLQRRQPRRPRRADRQDRSPAAASGGGVTGNPRSITQDAVVAVRYQANGDVQPEQRAQHPGGNSSHRCKRIIRAGRSARADRQRKS